MAGGADGGTACFVSDIHLPPEGAPGAEALAGAFGRLLSDLAARAADGPCALYVLGDLFAYWFESKGRVPRGFAGACDAIRDATARGLRVVALPGNRDFLLGQEFERRTGAEVAREGIVIALGGRSVLLTHGDALATGDHRYQLWKRFSRGGTFRRVSLGAPGWFAERVAASLRARSERGKRTRPRTAMRYAPGALGRRIAAGADVIIAGHVHEPGERVVEAGGRKGRLLVLGAWGDSPGARAEWDGERLSLVM